MIPFLPDGNCPFRIKIVSTRSITQTNFKDSKKEDGEIFYYYLNHGNIDFSRCVPSDEDTYEL